MEDANLELAKETIEAHKAMLRHCDARGRAQGGLGAHVYGPSVQAASQDARHVCAQPRVDSGARDALQSISSCKRAWCPVPRATSARWSRRGDKKLKDAAFQLAVDILGNVDVEDDKEDDMAALFTKELRAFATELEAKRGQVIKLTEAEQSELQAELNAYMTRCGLEDYDFKAPKEVKLEHL
ncbi:hypothetical protein PsorP6_006268 [Peronosclerospora sorghi]|uniref:Uncharacterized protein n=1 Tax=Peronosclerospora sorghi TaxID=230839 RepID=A0ACC0W2N5_9STRA|nr:hypothetical protein PsorP6_006268 [Peronosclerospora sorghi]